MEVNNDKGLLDNIGLIDSLIVDCNNAVKGCVGGQYIAFCNTMVQMVQKLVNLKSGIKSDLENREQTIRDYERRLAELGYPIEHFSGVDIGKALDNCID